MCGDDDDPGPVPITDLEVEDLLDDAERLVDEHLLHPEDPAGEEGVVEPHELADLLPNAEFVEVPGTHMGSVTKPDLGRAMAEWLGPAKR